MASATTALLRGRGMPQHEQSMNHIFLGKAGTVVMQNYPPCLTSRPALFTEIWFMSSRGVLINSSMHARVFTIMLIKACCLFLLLGSVPWITSLVERRRWLLWPSSLPFTGYTVRVDRFQSSLKVNIELLIPAAISLLRSLFWMRLMQHQTTPTSTGYYKVYSYIWWL